MYRTTAYVGHFLARFERNVKLYMACAALIGFSAFGIYSVLFNLYLLRMDYDVGVVPFRVLAAQRVREASA